MSQSPQAGLQTQFLGLADYANTYQAMRTYTQKRDANTPDSLWLCEHPPVFTLGLAGKLDHLLAPGSIPVVQSDRGGQVTYHGPGQVLAYALLDLHRLGIFVKEYVYRLEEAAIRTLALYDIVGHRIAGAPGIYIRTKAPFSHAILPRGDEKTPSFEGLSKIGALGVKVSRGYCYHGLSLNVAMDLEPFSRINPCGYAGLATLDMAALGVAANPIEVAQQLASVIQRLFVPPQLPVNTPSNPL